MKFVELYTGKDNKSHFMEVDAGVETEQPLGSYDLPGFLVPKLHRKICPNC